MMAMREEPIATEGHKMTRRDIDRAIEIETRDFIAWAGIGGKVTDRERQAIEQAGQTVTVRVFRRLGLLAGTEAAQQAIAKATA